MNLVARHRLTTETVQRWRSRAFNWGEADCVRLAACHLKRAGVRPPLGKAGKWHDAITAVRALKRAGFEALPDALDAVPLLRVTPAAVLPGDIVQMPGEGPLPALAIVLGNGRVLAWIDGEPGCTVLQPVAPPAAAWRVPL